ncbi:TPA: Serine/threonine-protein kinase 16 [Trebouxia sp. C0004]
MMSPWHLNSLLQILAGSSEQLTAAEKEVQVMTQLQHPNLLPLLAQAVVPDRSDGRMLQLVYMLFPESSLNDEVTRRQQTHDPFDSKDILQIFLQVCHGVQALHKCTPPLAHRDIKPHNVLLQRHKQHDSEAAEPTGSLSHPGDDLEAQPLHAVGAEPMSHSYHAVVMDFGSCQTAHMEVRNRTEALAVQEDAEAYKHSVEQIVCALQAHCTAPYKAPELFDVPSQCTIDERVDVWSLGCLLYFMMYGVSPFERAVNEAGGSLALAVINNNLWWPPQDRHTEELRMLVQLCLNSDPQTRPHVSDIISKAKTLLQ